MTSRDPRAKPTYFVAVVSLPALVIFFGGFGAAALHFAKSAEAILPGITPTYALADASRVPDGAYVEVDAAFRRDRSRSIDHPESLYVIERDDGRSEELLIVHCGAGCSDPSRTDRMRVRGRVCDLRPRIVDCIVPPSVKNVLAARPGPERRVLFLGETADDASARAKKCFGVAAFVLALYVAAIGFSRRRRKGPARVVEEKSWTVRLAAEHVALALRKLEAVDGFFVVEEAQGSMTFVQGRSENAARAWGVRAPEHFPRRAVVTWTSSPREPVRLVARIAEDLVWRPGALSLPMAALARASLARTAAQIDNVLDAR